MRRKKQHDPEGGPEPYEQQLHRIDHRAQLLSAAADLLADHDRRGRTRAHRRDLEQQKRRRGDGVGRDGARRHMPEDGSLDGVQHAPHRRLQHDRHRRAEIIPAQRRIRPAELRRAQLQLAVTAEHIDAHDAAFQRPRRQRADRRAHHAELRRAEAAEDQDIIDHAVRHQRHHRDLQRQTDRFHAAHRAQQHRRHGEEGEGEADNAQIPHALGDDRRVRHEQAHALRRPQRDHREKRASTAPPPAAARGRPAAGWARSAACPSIGCSARSRRSSRRRSPAAPRRRSG